MANGKEKYDALCIACHAASGGSVPGGVGPNLTDEYCLHGGGIKNIFKTSKYGIPGKGMISWEDELTEIQIEEESSYIGALEGSNTANEKEPQGDV